MCFAINLWINSLNEPERICARGAGWVLQFYQIKLQKSNGWLGVEFDSFSPLKPA
jgi:hypothetical protein